MSRLRIRKSFVLFTIILTTILIILKLLLFPTQNQCDNSKYLDYFKSSVNWSRYKIIQNGSQNRILVLGEARSGTSFLADLLHQSWPTFYAFEPLFPMKWTDVRNNQLNSQKAIKTLTRIFECDFDRLDNHVLCLWKNERNLVMQKYPGINKTTFWDKSINRFVCQRSDNLLIKSIRISIKQFIELQRKLQKSIKLVFIVRDPRGVMSSRYSPLMDWCKNDNKCATVGALCQRIKEDLNDLIKLSKILPELVSLVRYEDLSLHTMRTTEGLFKKLGLEYNIAIEKWIESHTNNKNHLGDPYSTIRQSKTMVFSWLQRLNSTQINIIQKECSWVMRSLGYNLVNFNNDSKIENDPKNVSAKDILSHNFELDYMIPKIDFTSK